MDPFVDCPRIQELTLTCSKHTYTVLSDILVHLSQSLKYLNILGYTPYPNIEQQQPLRQPLFPDATAPPVVQALSLHATMLSTDRFPMLSHLQRTGRYPDSSDLLTFLRGTPLLQTQHVHSGTSQSECPGARSQREPSRVRLDHLYALCLDLCGVPVRDISSLLRGLSIPPDATIQVHRIQLRNASDLHGLELPHLYSEEGIYTELEVAEGHLARRLHFRARGACGSLWVDIEGIDRATVDVFRPDIIRPMLANLPLALSTVETMRIAGMSTSCERHLIAHVLSAVEENRIPISSLVIASYNHKHQLGKYVREGLLVDTGNISDFGVGGCPLPRLKHLGIQVFQSIHDVEELLDMAKSRSSLQRPLSSITFSAPDALPIKGDVAVLEHHVGEVQFSPRRVWNLEADEFWKAENEVWPMYPHERDIESRGGLPCLGSNW